MEDAQITALLCGDGIECPALLASDSIGLSTPPPWYCQTICLAGTLKIPRMSFISRFLLHCQTCVNRGIICNPMESRAFLTNRGS